jgi:hypothetical protein
MFRKALTITSLLTLTLSVSVAAASETQEAMPEVMDEAAEAEGRSSDRSTDLTSDLCSDAGIANFSGQLILGDVGGSVYSTSPSASYGSAACGGRYVVDATGTKGKPNLAAEAMFADTGLGQSNCGSGRVAALFYGLNAATNTWVQLGGEIIAAGQWVPSPFGSGGSCQVAAVKAVSNTYSAVRVAAKAYIPTVFGNITKKVSANISAHY